MHLQNSPKASYFYHPLAPAMKKEKESLAHHFLIATARCLSSVKYHIIRYLGTTEEPEGVPAQVQEHHSKEPVMPVDPPQNGEEDQAPDHSEKQPDGNLGSDVPRKRRTDLPRRPGSGWYDTAKTAPSEGDQGAEPSMEEDPTASFSPKGSLRGEDEEEIAAALFDLAKAAPDEDMGDPEPEHVISSPPRKRPRKPPRRNVMYETIYDDAFDDDDWDAEDEYLAKRRGMPSWRGRGGRGSGGRGGSRRQDDYGDSGDAGRGRNASKRSKQPLPQHPGYMQNIPPHIAAQMHGMMPPPPVAPAPSKFKPGPNHVAISHFIQWHRTNQGNGAAAGGLVAPPQQQQQPMMHGGYGGHPQQQAAHMPKSQLNIAATVPFLAGMQAHLRPQQHPQQEAPGAALLQHPHLAALLGHLQASGAHQRHQEVLDVLQQALARQTAPQVGHWPQAPQPPAPRPQPPLQIKNEALDNATNVNTAASMQALRNLLNVAGQKTSQNQHALSTAAAAFLAQQQQAKPQQQQPNDRAAAAGPTTDMLSLMKQTLEAAAKARQTANAGAAQEQDQKLDNGIMKKPDEPHPVRNAASLDALRAVLLQKAGLAVENRNNSAAPSPEENATVAAAADADVAATEPKIEEQAAV